MLYYGNVLFFRMCARRKCTMTVLFLLFFSPPMATAAVTRFDPENHTHAAIIYVYIYTQTYIYGVDSIVAGGDVENELRSRKLGRANAAYDCDNGVVRKCVLRAQALSRRTEEKKHTRS